MAEQTQPVRRKVALKVLKAGMDTRQVVVRFEAERQALALMDHPNIARVFDGGETASGRPYFVMELVRGVPITWYCDEHRLTPRQRLELFVAVCQAVQHAHHKGIIHRDLKPSNVLVALYDGKPVPKVIDFGVAKAAGQPLTERTLVTGFGAVVGTLEYMSPEQAQLNQLDIDTRSDIYSLGVLLYELLTGTTPLERRRLRDTGLLEALRLIREEETRRPSARLSTTDELPAIAASRGLEPKRLSGVVRGDLDWIVMRALEKDRDRRYESANALAADVRRYLADEPVQACPPSAGYRLRKFLRRHRGPVLAAALVLLALVGGILGTTIGVVCARVSAEAERVARQAEADQRRKADAAEAELGRSRLGLSQKIDLLQKGVERQEAAVILTRGRLNRTLALLRTGAVDMSEGELTDARQGLVLEEAKLTELQTELSNLRELALRQKLLGPDHPDTLASLAHLAAGYEHAKRWEDAAGAYKELATLQRREGPAGSPELAATRARLGRCLLRQQKHAEAEALLREDLRDRAQEQPNDWLLDDARSLLGESLLGQQKYAEAESLLLGGYDGLKQREATIPAAERVCLAEALERLVRLYDATRQRGKADAWQKKLEETTVAPANPKP
jgi:hypothetical protein